MYEADTIAKLLERGDAPSPALAAPGRKSLSYDGLRGLLERTRRDLNAIGVGHGDRVAIVLPNGPEMASAFLTIANAATAAPLNPGYKQSEFDFYISDLHAKALIILEGMDSPSRAVASVRGIPIIELLVDADKPAGEFSLKAGASSDHQPLENRATEPEDIALVLHTSGTTARPKIVPLSHRNVTASAVNIRETLRLTRDDICLNIMPLFHIHGLIGAVLSSIAAGASVACAPEFDALKFFRWFTEIRPTWYTAVPTMHQAILARAARNADAVAASGLRLIRSSSSALPPQVLQELENVFRAPVIESYGMTEAAHQMASNPLPPREHFAGSVGVAAGPEIAIMNEGGGLLDADQIGEIVIRGRNVTGGYENNPEANAKSWTNGWFRTGDQGFLDNAGYLRLTGRIKELINRGGEKIGPVEVETALLDHPQVLQAAAFGMAHPMLGEEVAAAVVLRDGATANEQELREFVASRLAHFKVPRRIVVLETIPKGPTGKLQRIGLAKVLGLES
ncbi:MAG TPA: acyl--CoA ligase [Candidatus Binataceae bacterium]|nr:acyl--CoA ligase [Candidatus Binataceae bacterium]